MTPEDRFANLLSDVARAVTSRQASEVCCGDLTLEQFRTLAAVSASVHPSLGALAAVLGVDLSTMSRNATVLERNGYLARARSADDGRVVHVRLTAKGGRALRTLRCGERDVLGDVYERLPPEARPRVLKALETLRACLVAVDTPVACCPAPPARREAS